MTLRRALPLALALALLAGCEEEQTAAVVPLKEKDPNAFETKEPKVTFVDSGRVAAVLTARYATVNDARQETWLRDSVFVEFFDKKTGKRVSKLTCDSLRVDDATKDMRAEGHVLVVSDSTATRLETSTLMWSDSRRKLFTTEYVLIESPKERIEGDGMESDQTLQNYVIHKVRGYTWKGR